MMTVKNLTAGYGRQKILEGINFSLEPGTVTTLVGPNGCGKSTLLRTLARLLPKLGGEILLQGQAQENYGRKEFARLVSVLPQSRDIPALEAQGFVAHGRYPHLGFGDRLKEGDWTEIRRAMEETGTAHLRGRELSSLSGGERQRVYLAMCLAQNTQCLLLDEPTTYLDIGQKYELLDLLCRIAAQGKTVIMVLHDLSLAFEYSHKIAVLSQGRLQSLGSPQAVYEERVIDRVFGVHSAQASLEGARQFLFLKSKEERKLCATESEHS